MACPVLQVSIRLACCLPIADLVPVCLLLFTVGFIGCEMTFDGMVTFTETSRKRSFRQSHSSGPISLDHCVLLKGLWVVAVMGIPAR
jgi:hypothetical protein